MSLRDWRRLTCVHVILELLVQKINLLHQLIALTTVSIEALSTSKNSLGFSDYFRFYGTYIVLYLQCIV
jgi:hypothetical protein